VAVDGGTLPLVSVWTENPIPKDKIMTIADALRNIVLKAPVSIGQVVAENILGTGVNVVASREVNKK
jgi:CxxC motif-containing protein